MSGQPRFTIISAVHEVGRYLPAFIASVEAQDFDLGQVEVIVVDDGSTDDSLEQLNAWSARRPGLVRVVHQANAGQGAARNTGLDHATGEWITFPDPDDALAPNYLSAVDGFLRAHPRTDLVATNRMLWLESTGAVTNTHPLHRFFSYDRLVDLDENQTSFHGSAPAAFFRAELVGAAGLRFDVRIRPNFEDGHFTARYLLRCDRPMVGFLGSTAYHYRKRQDRSSSLQGSLLDPRRYTDVFTHGYLAILDEARDRQGRVPLWLQHFLAYELLGYLSSFEHANGPMIEPGAATEAFHAQTAAVLGQLDLGAVLPRLELTAAAHLTDVLQHGYAATNWVQPSVYVDVLDRTRQLARVRYRFSGEPPVEEVVNGEVVTGPRHAKTRALAYYGRTLLHERILWVRFEPDLRIRLDGDWTPIVFEAPAREVTRALALRVRRNTGSPSRLERRRVEQATPRPETRAARRARTAAATDRARTKYAAAWVLMDRVDAAGAGAEVLFRRLRERHHDVNAWFVVEDGSADFDRLRREFGKRVVAHGSHDWRVLMAHCAHLLSSRVDPAILRPGAITEFTEPTWRFTFLGDGVVTDDISPSLRSTTIDLFVTGTPAEAAALTGDGTPSLLTSKEVVLTGLPVFDALLDAAAAAGPPDLLLVVPAVPGPHWDSLLADPGLAGAAGAHGLTVRVQPDPGPEVLARAALLVTDRSAAAFSAAYLDRPVVYLQPDGAATAGHVPGTRPGSFCYATDGFGPVTSTHQDATAAIGTALSTGPDPAYADRVRVAFPVRDGRCCERVIAAVRSLDHPDDRPETT